VPSSLPRHQRRLRHAVHGAVAAPAAEPQIEAVEVDVDDRRRVEREQLTENQAADDGNAEKVK
jgi:hypothetical protein